MTRSPADDRGGGQGGTGESSHVPVMVEEVLRFLDLGEGARVLDLTLGGGGHARRILERVRGSTVVGVDRDASVLRGTAERLKGRFGTRFEAVHAGFDRIDDAALERTSPFQGVLADLGVSSLQLDDADRGMSFAADGELDMRMDRSVGETAAELLLRVSEQELADLLFRFGDERRARAIAEALCARRRHAPLRRTSELAEIVSRAVGGRRGARIHPATRTFQALRIAVNDELGALARMLPRTERWLAAGGRLVVISFHSGEDRIVKRFLRERERAGAFESLHRKAVEVSPAEAAANPRARSAKLRAARRTCAPVAAGPE